MTCKKTGIPGGSLWCNLECPNLKQGPLLATCTQRGSLRQCECDPSNPSFFPCTTTKSPICAWVAGGGSGAWPQIVVSLPKSTPSIRSVGLHDMNVRQCANQHLPLTWVNDNGEQTSPDSLAWWTLVEDTNSTEGLVFSAPVVTGHDTGRPDWHPKVLADPETAVKNFGTCMYNVTMGSVDLFKKTLTDQLRDLVPSPPGFVPPPGSPPSSKV